MNNEELEDALNTINLKLTAIFQTSDAALARYNELLEQKNMNEEKEIRSTAERQRQKSEWENKVMRK